MNSVLGHLHIITPPVPLLPLPLGMYCVNKRTVHTSHVIEFVLHIRTPHTHVACKKRKNAKCFNPVAFNFM